MFVFWLCVLLPEPCGLEEPPPQSQPRQALLPEPAELWNCAMVRVHASQQQQCDTDGAQGYMGSNLNLASDQLHTLCL